MEQDPGVTIREVSDPADPEVEAVAGLLLETFADPNIVLPAARMREFLEATRAGSPAAGRTFHVLTARAGGRLAGATVFSYVAAAGVGFSEYMVVAPGFRGQGVARRLFDARRAVLDRQARTAGRQGAAGLFIEVENPERTPAEFLERERTTAIDAWARLRFFHHLGFRRCDLTYVQPPLAPGREPVDYLDLLFLPWDESIRRAGVLPPQVLLDAVKPIWAGWAPDTYEDELRRLGSRIGGRPVRLVPLFPQ